MASRQAQIDYVALPNRSASQFQSQAAQNYSPSDVPHRQHRLISRRRLEDIQIRETCQKYNRQHLNDLAQLSVIFMYLTLCHTLPAASSKNADCKMETSFANAVFAWVLIGAQMLLHIVFIIGYEVTRKRYRNALRLKLYVEEAAKLTTLGSLTIITFGWAAFFYWTQSLWKDIDSGRCLEGWNLLDFINWLVILAFTVWPAVLVTVMCFIFVFCAPCLVKYIQDYQAHLQRGQNQRNSVINALVRRHYRVEDFHQHTECAICMVAFKEDEEVTPLPCNPAHYFHSQCIVPWLQTNSSCPLCREEITREGFEREQARLQQLEQQTGAEAEAAAVTSAVAEP